MRRKCRSDPDVIPMLLQHLQEHKAGVLDSAPAASQKLVPRYPRISTSVAVAVSGFGLLINRSALSLRIIFRRLPTGRIWACQLRGALLMSSPSRSDTNHFDGGVAVAAKRLDGRGERCWQSRVIWCDFLSRFRRRIKIKAGLALPGRSLITMLICYNV